MNVGDSIGIIMKEYGSGRKCWWIREDIISGISFTKKHGRMYLTESFSPIDADYVDKTTKMAEELIDRGCFITNEVFGLNEKTRPFVENWIKWTNDNYGNMEL